MKNIKGSFILTLTALIWGFAFVSQSVGMDYVGPFTFNAVRNFIATIVLIPTIYLLKVFHLTKSNNNLKMCIQGGILCGIILGTAMNLQQIGIQYTSVGKAGFITALYIVIVPILYVILTKKHNSKLIFSVVLALIGLYLLTMNESFTISKGDFYILLCAFVFSLHILVIDYYSPKVNCVLMSCIQFFVAGIISSIFMCLYETPTWSSIVQGYVPILYAGVLSSGVAYTLQIVGQQNTDPTVASLILSLESVFSVLAGFLLLHQALSIKELMGCILVFIAIILAQLPQKEKNQ